MSNNMLKVKGNMLERPTPQPMATCSRDNLRSKNMIEITHNGKIKSQPVLDLVPFLFVLYVYMVY